MSQLSNIRLPSGGALEWDMTTLTNDQLEYEYELAHESLYGHKVKGEIVLKGFLDPEYKSPYFDKTSLEQAITIWKLRFSRAEDELERRYLLS